MWENIRKLKHFWVFLLLLCTWLVSNYPIMGTLWEYGFDDGTYSHSFLVPFIILYLIYILDVENRIQFRASLSLAWFTFLILTGFTLWIATLSQISLLYWVTSLLVLIALIFQVFRFNISTLFPIAYIVFVYPFWGSLALLFQKISVFMVTIMMSLTDIPVYVENEFVTIPAGIFEIAEGCSGLRYIIVSLAISSLYIFLYLRTFKAGLVFACFAIFGALVTNWIRIVLLIVIGHVTDMESSLMTDHNNFGWYIYVPVAILQFYLGKKLEEKEERDLGRNEYIASPIVSKLSKPILYTALVLSVFLSSSLAVMSSKNSQEITQCSPISTKVAPMIFNASLTCETQHLVGDISVTELNYWFDGSTLDAKASYYLNSAIPEGYKEIGTMPNDNWNVVIVADALANFRLIAYRYQVGSEYETKLYNLKKQRLLNALKLSNLTAIHWISSQCKNECNAEDLKRLNL